MKLLKPTLVAVALVSVLGCQQEAKKEEVVAKPVLETEIQDCTVTDKRRANRIKKSLEKAVLNTSPLPRPEDETVFTRQIYFDFSKT